MNIAINKDGKRILASNANRDEKYFCPICGSEMIVRHGYINEIHFAHKSNECLDKWHHDMSEWHYTMQERFAEDEREIIVEYNGIKHRADILKGKQVIEMLSKA